MPERSIVCDDQSVRAILAGHKTQFRRAIKNIPWRKGCNPEFSQASAFVNAGEFRIAGSHEMTTGFRCPFGMPGDRLWVKEVWAPRTLGRWSVLDKHMEPLHRASNDRPEWKRIWRPGITMPRWASRLLLEVASVRVQRLHQITHRDAIQEGAKRIEVARGCDPMFSFEEIEWTEILDHRAFAYKDPRHAFRDRWANAIGKWEPNQWVWAVEFRRIEQ